MLDLYPFEKEINAHDNCALQMVPVPRSFRGHVAEEWAVDLHWVNILELNVGAAVDTMTSILIKVGRQTIQMTQDFMLICLPRPAGGKCAVCTR
jgi:hypothetical protein